MKANRLPFLLLATGLTACFSEPSGSKTLPLPTVPADASLKPQTSLMLYGFNVRNDADTPQILHGLYDLVEPQSEIVFLRSRGDYRIKNWKIYDARGSRLDRIGSYDRLVFDSPTTDFRVGFRPVTGPFSGTYDPALHFTDGGIALFLDQFSLAPLDSLTAEWGADLSKPTARPGDFQPDEAPRKPFAIAFNTSERIVVGAQEFQGPIEMCLACGADTPAYIYIGNTPLVEGENFTALLDPGLPDWLRDSLDSDMSESFDQLSAMFGDRLPRKGQLIANFKGYELSGYSQSGSVAGDAVILSFEGSAFGEPSPEIAQSLATFLAHEASHLYQARKVDLAYDDPWLHEGHATALSYAVVASRYGDGLPEYALAQRDDEDSECKAALTDATLRDALNAKPYACGQLVWRSLAGSLAGSLASNLATSGRNLAKLWDALIATADGAPLSEAHLLDILPDPAPLRTALDLSGEAALDALQ